MKKLNNNGLTAIEVLVCFAIISVIVTAMFNIVNNYKEKKDLESYKLDITTYKHVVAKTIYDDIIDNQGVVSGSYKQLEGDTTNPSEIYKQNTFKYVITLYYKSGKSSTITIYTKNLCYKYERDAKGKKKITARGQECTPEISENIDYENSEYYISFEDSEGTIDKFDLPHIYQLKYNDIMPKGIDEDDDIFHIRIGLRHIDFGEKYDALNIVTPNVSKYPGML